MKTTEKTKLDIVKEIERQEPKELTFEYSVKYLKAIGWMLMNVITKEEADRYLTTPDSIEEYYEKMYRDVKRYIREHFDPHFFE